MDSLSENTRKELLSFLRLWTKEAADEQQITITTTQITFEGQEEAQTIHIEDLLRDNLEPVIEKCKTDLMRVGIEVIPFPDYLVWTEEERLRILVNLTTQPTFKSRKSSVRMETFYYLGEVLAARGWRKSDKKIIRDSYDGRTARIIEKTAKRVFELFLARGLAQLYTIEYICPTRLEQMKEGDFYEHLITTATQLQAYELNQMIV
jgi:hypothetical protein